MQTFKKWRARVLAAFVAALSTAAGAVPLAMTYSVAPGPAGQFTYGFTLTLDNHDGSWQAGQSFNWFVIGDTISGTSPLANFVGDPARLPIGPFTLYEVTSGGGHAGPALLDFGGSGWVPSAPGDTLSWSGVSTSFLGQGGLRFSNLLGSGAQANFEVATMHAVPEPSTWALLFAGMLALGLRAKNGNIHLAGPRPGVRSLFPHIA